MEEIMDFISVKTISRDAIFHEKVFITEEMKQHFKTDAEFFYREILEPQITIKEKHLIEALEMARKLGFKQGEELISVQ